MPTRRRTHFAALLLAGVAVVAHLMTYALPQLVCVRESLNPQGSVRMSWWWLAVDGTIGFVRAEQRSYNDPIASPPLLPKETFWARGPGGVPDARSAVPGRMHLPWHGIAVHRFAMRWMGFNEPEGRGITAGATLSFGWVTFLAACPLLYCMRPRPASNRRPRGFPMITLSNA